jgi:HEPN domain-containing protein
MDKALLEWIKFSDRDFAAARYLYDNMRPIPLEIVCYHCQQSAEKALKAFLIHSKIKPEKTHDLESLRDNCAEIENSFNEIIEMCERLNDYASQPRYPFEIEITDDDTLLALHDSEKINGFVKSKIKWASCDTQ